MQELTQVQGFEKDKQIIQLLEKRFIFFTKELEKTNDLFMMIHNNSIKNDMDESLPNILTENESSNDLRKVPNTISDFNKAERKFLQKQSYGLAVSSIKSESEYFKETHFVI